MERGGRGAAANGGGIESELVFGLMDPPGPHGGAGFIGHDPMWFGEDRFSGSKRDQNERRRKRETQGRL